MNGGGLGTMHPSVKSILAHVGVCNFLGSYASRRNFACRASRLALCDDLRLRVAWQIGKEKRRVSHHAALKS